MDCYITLNGIKYIKEDIHKKQLETMKRMYEQKDVGMIPVSDLKFGSIFLDSHGKKFLKVDSDSLQSYFGIKLPDYDCLALSLKTHRIVMFSGNQPVRPLEGN